MPPFPLPAYNAESELESKTCGVVVFTQKEKNMVTRVICKENGGSGETPEHDNYSPDPPLREPTIKRTQVVWRPGGPKRLECACFSAVKVPFYRQNRLRERVTPRAPVLLTVGPDCSSCGPRQGGGRLGEVGVH